MARTASDLDTAETASFIDELAVLFEGAPRFLARLAPVRPFGSLEALLERAREIAHAMPEDEQVELVDAHPRLGAPPERVSVASFREQGYGREAADAAAEVERIPVDAELARLNDEYEQRFGFRYCVFVAGRSRAALLPEFRAALGSERNAELRRALDAVIDIAADRARRRLGSEENGS